MYVLSNGQATLHRAAGIGQGEWRCSREPAVEGWASLGLVGTWNCAGWPHGLITISWDYADDFSTEIEDDFVRVCAPLPLPYSLHSWYNTYAMDPSIA